MAESPDGSGVILFGGRTDENSNENRILELSAGANSWKILNITLENGRQEHVVIPLFTTTKTTTTTATTTTTSTVGEKLLIFEKVA